MPADSADLPHAGGPRVAGLVPAAGASRRLGRDKRRLPFRGRTVLEVTLDSLRLGGAAPLVVVLEPRSPCRGLPGLADATLVVNPRPERGMLSSIREGLAALPPQVEAAALLPGDHPFVPPEAVAALLRRFADRRPPLLAPLYGQRRGHPLLLARALFEEAAACDDEVGLRQLVWRRQAELDLLPLDLPGADDDLDRPQDLERLKR
jgi:molybdenum cofactor cytidylyltransferase